MNELEVLKECSRHPIFIKDLNLHDISGLGKENDSRQALEAV
jgi:hypothetical protein